MMITVMGGKVVFQFLAYEGPSKRKNGVEEGVFGDGCAKRTTFITRRNGIGVFCEKTEDANCCVELRSTDDVDSENCKRNKSEYRTSNNIEKMIPSNCGYMEVSKDIFRLDADLSFTDAFLSYVHRGKGRAEFNLVLISSMALRFLSCKESTALLPIKQILGLTETPPRILILGYIYLDRYVRKTHVSFNNYSTFMNFFLVCCVIGAKFMHDMYCQDLFPCLRDWHFSAREMNYTEGLILSTINYDIEVSNEDIRIFLLRNGVFHGYEKSRG